MLQITLRGALKLLPQINRISPLSTSYTYYVSVKNFFLNMYRINLFFSYFWRVCNLEKISYLTKNIFVIPTSEATPNCQENAHSGGWGGGALFYNLFSCIFNWVLTKKFHKIFDQNFYLKLDTTLIFIGRTENYLWDTN